MSVKIDPSEVRARPAAAARHIPWRKVAFGGVGSIGLAAFAFGAFAFFEGIADPRARTPRPKPVAMNLPDLKDGVPALAPSTDAAAQAAAPAPVLNLPRPPAAEPQHAADAPDIALRSSRQATADPVATPVAPAAADATGSVSSHPAAARPVPQIENAQTVAADAKPVPLIAPARTETVKAKGSEARDVAALPPEPDVGHTPPVAKPQHVQAKAPEPKVSEPKVSEPKVSEPKTPDPKRVESRRVETKPTPSKPTPTRTAKATPAKPVVEASAEPARAPAPRAQVEDSDGIVAGVQKGWNASVKAVGGMFGGD